MLGGYAVAHSDGLSDYKGYSRLAAEHVANLGRLIYQFISGAKTKVGKSQLNNRPRSSNGCPNRAADYGVFGDRRIEYSFFSKGRLQPFVLARNAPFWTEVFSKCPYADIPLHLLLQR